MILKEKIKELRARFDEELAKAGTPEALESLRVAFLGKKGPVTDLMAELRNVEQSEKAEAGQLINTLKNELSAAIAKTGEVLRAAALAAEIRRQKKYNPTLPSREAVGSYHPITLVQRELEEIFSSMGFTIEDYPEIVDDYHCFEALNIPKHHPARDMQDTYYIENGQLLKTHTSAAQNYIMKKYGAPLRAIFPGRCFRNEAIDACHENTFFQMEGIMIDENISISNLIYFMKTMLSEVFRLRARHQLPDLRRQGLPVLQELRLARTLPLRDDPSERPERRRDRHRPLHRVRVRAGADPARDDEIRGQGHPRLQRRLAFRAVAVR